jgi:glutathione peroxidase
MMSKILLSAGVIAIVGVAVFGLYIRSVTAGPSVTGEPSTQPAADSTGPLQFNVKDIDGKDVSLADYRGKVVLIVNVASRCGFTKQYDGLQKLYDFKKEGGLVVLGFPCNDFGSQEPGSEEEIKAFCSSKFNVTFPMFSKVVVKGDAKAPLYKYLTEASGEYAGEIKWNFTKFVVDRSGKLVGRFPSNVAPDAKELVELIDKALSAK